ncbi:unnamed protein product [Onchocerca flexuosa]|uniref:Uncharacterized protein n=1 Tax=Onchocerca flexuosa TaxID=387005 RepID=A0A183H207_9BILA|nr:unnamed protein product [Onchocerca flexuosa]
MPYLGYCAVPDDQPCSSSDELTLINKNSELRQSGNGRSQANLDSKNNPMHCPRSFMKNVFHAEYSSIRRTVPLNERSIDVISLNGSERGVDILSPIHSLPPRPPSRSNSIGRFSQNRPPPPTYQSKNCIKQPAVSNKPPPPPPYKSRVMVRLSENLRKTPTKQITEFSPKATSTPKLEHSESEPCSEDERSTVCDRTERNEKTRSIYENVDHSDISVKAEIGTVWYEYGCV